jgi:hypothetical protein
MVLDKELIEEDFVPGNAHTEGSFLYSGHCVVAPASCSHDAWIMKRETKPNYLDFVLSFR